MTEKIEVEVYIVMDSDGCYGVGYDEESATADYTNDYDSSGARRVAKLTVKMTPAAIEEGPTVDIPDDAGTIEHIEAEATA